MAARVVNQDDWLSDLIHGCFEAKTYTPDMAELNVFDNQLILCYGTLKYGRSRNHLMKKATFMNYAFTDDTDFSMKYSFNGQYPAACREGWDKRQGRIWGEIWSVPTHQMPAIDAIEGNTALFTRELIDCIIPSIEMSKNPYTALDAGKEPHVVKDVWLYVASDKIRTSNVGAFTAMVPKESPILGRYYSFDKKINLTGYGNPVHVD